MNSTFSAEQLADQVNGWCVEHGIRPASGQAGELITVRNIRYYRSLGLLDGPGASGGAGFGEKHRLQLLAVRLLQARGLPLQRIQELLYGRSLEELREIERRGLAEWLESRAEVFQPSHEESWCVTPLNEEFMVVSRRGRKLPPGIKERLRAVLESNQSAHGGFRANHRSIE